MSTQSKIKLKKVEFYITNVCNLTCDNCNRFNNHKFKGWQAWNDYKDIYAKWSENIELNTITLLGGEPLLNPTIIDWIKGLCELWPTTQLELLTNGYRLNEVKGLYEALLKHRWFASVSVHNTNEAKVILNEVDNFLQQPVNKEFHNPKNLNNYCLTDKNFFKIHIMKEDMFAESAIKIINNKITLHNSDPVKAHDICAMAQCKSYHFIKGKLYKCGPAALFPEIDQQFELDLSNEDRDLINSYRPLTVDNFEEFHSEFFANLDNPIPQCKFCPEEHNLQTIYPLVKGS
jgi:organic radical activating enzyme